MSIQMRRRILIDQLRRRRKRWKHSPPDQIAAHAAAAGTRTARGNITIVQEQRFRLVTDDGRGLLLTLAYDAYAPNGDLQRLHDSNTRVIVEYTGEPNLESGAPTP
jgi:hypothetical protein